MLRLLLVFVLTVSLCIAEAGGVVGDGNVSGPELVWKMYEQEPSYQARGVVRSGDGGFIIAADIVREARPYYPRDYYEFEPVLVKVNRWGAKVWEKSVGIESGDGSLKCISPSGDGGFAVAGILDRTPKGSHASPGPTSAVFVKRVDGDGNLLWNKTHEDTDTWLHDHLAMTPCGDGGFVVLGRTLLRIDGDGNLLWSKTYQAGDRGSVASSRDGGFVVAGSKQVCLVADVV